MKQTITLSLIATALLATTSFAQEDLGEIVVTTATKSAQRLKSVTSDVDVITAEDIEARGYTTVAQVLSSVAGISTVSNGGLGASTSVYLRGMKSQNTLVLIDGIRYNDVTSTNGAPWSDLMVDDIARIEVVKGAQSGIWGADASAGVINIITKTAQKGTHATAHLEGGSFGTKKYGVTLSTATESYYAKVGYQIVDNDGFTAIAPYGNDIDTYEDDEYKNQTLNLKAGYNFNADNALDLAYTYIKGKGDGDPFGNPDGEYGLESTYKFMKANFRHSDSLETLNLYAQRSDFSRYYPDAGAAYQHYDGKVDEFGLNSKFGYRTDDFILVGVDRKKFNHENTLNKSYTATGLFTTNSNTFEGLIGGTTILTESLRYDKYSDFENKTTGKIGLKHIHKHIEGLVTSFNYGTAYTIPTPYQLFAPATNWGPVGNQNLKPEETKSYDVTVAYKDLSLTYFNNKIDNLIQYTTGYNNVNGTSKIDGIELSYQTAFGDNLLFNANYTHLFTFEDNQGNKLLRRPKKTFNLALDYYGIKKLHLGTDIQFVEEKEDLDYNAYPPAKVKVKKYTVINMTADYQITDNLQVYGKIENLTDKYYQTAYGYATSPRAFYTGIKVKF